MFCRKTQRDKEEVTLMDRKMLHTRKFSLTFIKKSEIDENIYNNVAR